MVAVEEAKRLKVDEQEGLQLVVLKVWVIPDGKPIAEKVTD